MLYIMLIVIPVLGILALLLIFWDRIHWPKKRTKTIVGIEENLTSVEQCAEDEWQDNVRVVRPAATSAQTRIDPALGDLEFGALDDLLTVETAAQPTASKPVVAIKKTAATPELMILYVMAPAEQPFEGYELVQTLTALGLQYGNLNIFHYHQTTPEEEQGSSLFSVASAVEPGMFDLSNVGAIVCPGLSLFMSTQVDSAVDVFETMLETAQQLAEDLNGVVCDVKRLPLTETAIAEYRRNVFESSF